MLGQLAAEPSRAHRVIDDARTTFVLTVTNPGPGAADVELTVSNHSENWSVTLAWADERFQPEGNGGANLQVSGLQQGDEMRFVVAATPHGRPVGSVGEFKVEASLANGGAGCVTLQAEVTDTPKVYFIGIDGLDPRYVLLGRDGERNPAPADLLMPRLREFLSQAAWFPQARASLPAATDMNVFGVLSGSWPGTAGIPSVFRFFRGFDAAGDSVYTIITRDDLKYGPTGLPVWSVFDVVKDETLGGDAQVFTSMISGKGQTDHLFLTLTGETAIDALADGARVLPYLTQPQAYLLGDPPSDPNKDTDRDGVNLRPFNEFRMHPIERGLHGDDPASHPEDRWVAESGLRIMAADDPDVMDIHLAGVDKIQHAAGAAHTPEEWADPGTPDILWDDFNYLNPNLNREPVLDVVYEADFVTGLVLDVLQSRNVFERSIVVIYSDHGGQGYINGPLNLNAILAELGVLSLVRRTAGVGELANLSLWNPSDADTVAEALETYAVFHPVLRRWMRPFFVLTQEEMETGVDNVFGQFARDGGPGRGELYSEWLIEHPVNDNTQVVWPDIMVFSRAGYKMETSDDSAVVLGGHSGPSTSRVMLAIRGPSYLQGVFDEADTSLVDVAPTIYETLGLTAPGNVDGRVLTEILLSP